LTPTRYTFRLLLLALAVVAASGLRPAQAAAQACSNLTGSTVDKPRLFVGSLNDPGKHKISFSGTAIMPHDPPVNLLANGFRFVVEDGQGDVVVDATVPPGAYDPLTKNGWRANGRGGFFYKNNGAALNNGLFSVTVNELRAAPGKFQFRIKAKDGSYALAPADLPLRVTVILDPPTAATTGQCTEAQYADECRFNKAESTVRCKPPI